jgi:hypothetical protein
MKTLSILIVALLATAALSNFVPVTDYDLTKLAGNWHVQSIYDTTGNNWSNAYCFGLGFIVLNQSVVNLTSYFIDGTKNQLTEDGVFLYPDSEYPSIMYQDTTHKLPPLLVLNVSSLPYWVLNDTDVSIFAFNYTTDSSNPQYIIFGASRWYDTAYDIRPFLNIYNFPINYNKNFWLVNSACDTHFEWLPVKNFNASSLLKDWNLIAVYDPAGSDLVPWYTGAPVYDWSQAYCGKVSFEAGQGNDDQMTMSLKSLYQGSFERSWQIYSYYQQESVLNGFNIDENTLLYVQYAGAGNLILTTGTTTSFFLSTLATSLTPVERDLFEISLSILGWETDLSYIYPIDSSSC